MKNNFSSWFAEKWVFILYYVFIAVNIIPNLLLLITEPYDAVGKIVLLIMPLGVLLILTSLIRRVGGIQLALLPLFFFHAFQLVVFSLFKEDVVAVDMFLNLVTTNASEAGELLKSILVPTLVVCFTYILVIVFVIISFRKKVYYTRGFLRKNLIVGVILTLFSFLLLPFGKEENTQTFDVHVNVYPVNVMYNMYFAFNKLNKINHYDQTSSSFTFDVTKRSKSDAREIVVLVIGETSRAENWGAYGYERETTPNISSDDNFLVFQDALTQSNTTHKSVSIILSPTSAENYDDIYDQKSILTAFKEAGFNTVFLSNQARNASFIEFFGDEADHVEYFREVNSATNHYDDVLLERIKHYVHASDQSTFIVVHTYGSHFNYGERYPKEFQQFTPDLFSSISEISRPNMVNAYDNSILYTDYLLNEISKLLEVGDTESALLYLSDHGEDIMDDVRGRFLHASPNPTYYQLRIPFIMWFSDDYIKLNPEKVELARMNQNTPVSSSMVFHTLLDVAGIESSYVDKGSSLVNTDLEQKPRMYLGDHDNPVHFTKTNLKKEDVIMLEKNNISTY